MFQHGYIPYSPDLCPGEEGEVMARGHLDEDEATEAAEGWGLIYVGDLKHTYGRFIPPADCSEFTSKVYWPYPKGAGAFKATTFTARRPS